MKTIKFYKTEQGSWYIDLPEYIELGGHISHLLMVAGADTLLDIVSSDGNEAYLQVSEANEFDSDKDVEILLKTKEPMSAGMGCTYRLSVVSQYYDKFKERHDDEIWLCPTTLFVFDEKYPDRIYFRVITKTEYEASPNSFATLKVG